MIDKKQYQEEITTGQETKQPENSQPIISNRRYLKTPSCAISLGDLKKLFVSLKAKVKEAKSIEIDNLQKEPEITDNDFEELKTAIADRYRLYVVINGAKGEQIIDHSEDVFDSSNLPEEIATVIFNSGLYYKLLFEKDPKNHLFVLFDFRKPRLVDFSNPVTEPTPNGSYVEVIGNNETWVRGVFDKIESFIESRGTKRQWLHSHYTYSILVNLIGIPIAFWVVFRFDHLLKSLVNPIPLSIEVALYVYIVLQVLNLFRILFLYSRWVYPLIENRDQDKDSSHKQRIILGTIGSSLLLALIYDVLKTLLM